MNFTAGHIMPLGVQLHPHPRVGQQEDVAFEPCQLLVLSVAPNSSIIQDNEPSAIPQVFSGLFLYL